jgi:SpoVK/Ycf46/Vps4 family AAA+-type ATPase
MAMIPTGSRIQTTPREDTTLQEVIAEIGDLIGMDNIKHELNSLIALGSIIQLRRERDIPLEKMSLHLIFMGPPGTGKTIVARKIGKLFKAIGLLRTGHCVEVDRATLISTFSGGTGPKVREAVMDAKGGVLFIDEAYAIAGGDDVHSATDNYGREAINTLLKMMEDHRHDVVVIVAGYTNKMRRFMEANPGLRSRFNRELKFASYKHDELFNIFRVMVAEGKYDLSQDAAREAEKHIRTWDIMPEDFGNAREVRNFFEKILPNQALRLSQTPDIRSLSNDQLLTITAEDVRATAA